MRTAQSRQTKLTAPRSPVARAKELADIDQLLEDTPSLAVLVTADLPHAEGVSADTGRPGLTGEQVLRAALIRTMEGFTYEDLEFHLSDSATYRSFCRLGWGEKHPSASTLQENIRRVRPATWEAINHAVIGVAVEKGLEPGDKTRIDCTVTQSNIHPPDDAAQLYDVVRVVTRLLVRAGKLRPGVAFHDRTKRAKRRRLEVMDKKGDRRTAAYADLLKVTTEVLAWVPDATTALRGGADAGDEAHRLADELQRYAGLGERVIDQTRRRVFGKEKVPAQEKVVSIFEPHTDIIVKDNREVLYGHKILVATGSTGLVQHCTVLDGNPADSTLVEEALRQVETALGKMPRQAAMDGCFASAEGLALAKAAGVRDICFSKRRGMAVTAMAKSEWVYRKLWRFRAGIEAGISWLKRCFGLGRCTWRGKDGFHAYVHSGVAAFNILLLARLSAA